VAGLERTGERGERRGLTCLVGDKRVGEWIRSERSKGLPRIVDISWGKKAVGGLT